MPPQFTCKFILLTGLSHWLGGLGVGGRGWSTRQGICTRIDESGWLRFQFGGGHAMTKREEANHMISAEGGGWSAVRI